MTSLRPEKQLPTTSLPKFHCRTLPSSTSEGHLHVRAHTSRVTTTFLMPGHTQTPATVSQIHQHQNTADHTNKHHRPLSATLAPPRQLSLTHFRPRILRRAANRHRHPRIRRHLPLSIHRPHPRRRRRRIPHALRRARLPPNLRRPRARLATSINRMAQVQALDSILACNRLRDLHAHRHRYRPWSEAVVRARIPDDVDRQRHLRFYFSRYFDLHWACGTHGARVHVQRVHAAGAN